MSLLISSNKNVSISEELNKKLEEVTNLILAEEKMDEAIINLRLVDNKKMQKLNMKFRNKDKTTNVLSFTNDDISLKQTNNIGDIAISVEYVLNESEDIGKNFDEHMIHMLAHGIYHILGHDHQVDSMAEVMESKEISTLKKLNINNPYH